MTQMQPSTPPSNMPLPPEARVSMKVEDIQAILDEVLDALPALDSSARRLRRALSKLQAPNAFQPVPQNAQEGAQELAEETIEPVEAPGTS